MVRRTQNKRKRTRGKATRTPTPKEAKVVFFVASGAAVEKLKAARYSANVGRLRETLEFLNSAAEETRQARKALFLIDANPKAKQDLKPFLTFYTQAGRRKQSKEIHGEK